MSETKIKKGWEARPWHQYSIPNPYLSPKLDTNHPSTPVLQFVTKIIPPPMQDLCYLTEGECK